MRRIWAAVFVLGCATWIGCDAPAAKPTGAATEADKKQEARAAPKPPEVTPPPSPDAVPVPVPTAPPTTPSDEIPPGMERVVARAGVIDPKSYDAGIITTPLTANFSLQQQLIFDAAIPKALKTFEAAYSRRPRSHQEFMREIIVKSNIRLPSLPIGWRYVYDPGVGDFMIERPKTGD